MRKILAGLLVGALAVSGMAAAADPIRIGVVNEITGAQAEAGQFTVNGIKLALDEIRRSCPKFIANRTLPVSNIFFPVSFGLVTWRRSH